MREVNKLSLWLILYTLAFFSSLIFVESTPGKRTRSKRQGFYFDDDFSNGEPNYYEESSAHAQGRKSCEESSCGSNVRHCPHGCSFNSYLCYGGASYDECCC